MTQSATSKSMVWKFEPVNFIREGNSVKAARKCVRPPVQDKHKVQVFKFKVDTNQMFQKTTGITKQRKIQTSTTTVPTRKMSIQVEDFGIIDQMFLKLYGSEYNARTNEQQKKKCEPKVIRKAIPISDLID